MPPDKQDVAPSIALRPTASACAVSPEETQRRLWLALVEARRKYLQAVAEQDAIIAEVPRGLPAPDGIFRVEQAGRARREAHEDYMAATKAFSDFLLQGKA